MGIHPLGFQSPRASRRRPTASPPVPSHGSRPASTLPDPPRPPPSPPALGLSGAGTFPLGTGDLRPAPMAVILGAESEPLPPSGLRRIHDRALRDAHDPLLSRRRRGELRDHDHPARAAIRTDPRRRDRLGALGDLHRLLGARLDRRGATKQLAAQRQVVMPMAIRQDPIVATLVANS